MKSFSKSFASIILLFLLSSCAAMQNFSRPSELDGLEKGTKMDLKKFFSGEIEGFGIALDDNGKIIGTKIVKINGKWEENKGVVQYNFVYPNGNKDSRTWLITLHDDGTFDAVGHNVAAPAEGQQNGNAARMNYSLVSTNKGQKTETRYEDKMYLVDEKSMIMNSTFSTRFSASGKEIISLKKSN